MKKAARRDLKKLPRQIQTRIVERLAALAVNPRPHGADLLSGIPGVWRVREGDFRILYTIKDEVLLVLVLRVGNRREIYRLSIPALAMTEEEDGDGSPQPR